LIKEYREERNLNIFFLIDVSQTMLFGSTPKIKSEYAGEIAASLAYLIQKSGDRIGFCLFSDKVVKIRPPTAGMGQFHILLKEISDVSNWGGKFRFKNVLEYLFGLLDNTTVVVIVSDFIGLEKEKGWDETLKRFTKKFDTLIFMVRDPRDESLPKESIEVTVEDPFSDKTLFIDSKLIARKYEKHVKRVNREILNGFLSCDIDFIKIRTDKTFLQQLIVLLKKRAGRLKLH
jgi:uncharacterized protein (DUF58 family)